MKHFETRLQNTPGIGLLQPDPRITRLAPYGYVFKYFANKVKDIPRAAFVGRTPNGRHTVRWPVLRAGI